MATGQASSPVRFGKGQSSPVDNRSLYLDVFGGEVITRFDNATVTLDKHTVKTLSGGAKSYRFPKTWKADAEYHTPAQNCLVMISQLVNSPLTLTTFLSHTMRLQT